MMRLRLRWCRSARVRRLCTQHEDAPRLQAVIDEFMAVVKRAEPKPPSKAPPPKRIQAVRGFKARFPVEVESLRHIEQTLIRVCSLYGFREVRLPVVEYREVFERSVNDLVTSKELFAFPSNSGSELALRPEGTAGVMRAIAEADPSAWAMPLKLFYNGPMFRYERPQKGRYRQFQQFGVEFLGDNDALADVECIEMAHSVLVELGLEKHVVLHLNTLGDAEARQKYNKALAYHLGPLYPFMSDASKKRFDSGNAMRILDSKDPKDTAALLGSTDVLPKMVDFLSSASQAAFERVKCALRELGIHYELDPKLVRGLDYYGDTAFEFVSSSSALGCQQGAVLAGGRYDGLSCTLGARQLPAVGWACGVERLALLKKSIADESNKAAASTAPVVAVLSLDAPADGIMLDSAECEALKTAKSLRADGFTVVQKFGHDGPGAMFRWADRQSAAVAVFIGPRELEQRVLLVKNLRKRTQTEIVRKNLFSTLRREMQLV